MNKVIVLILCFFAIHFSLAQDLVLSPSEVFLALDEHIDYDVVFLENTTENDIEIAMTLEPLCTVNDDNTGIQICIGQLCLPPERETTTWGESGNPLWVLMAGETSGLFSFKPLPTPTVGSEWSVTFFDRNNPSIAVILTVHIDQCGTTHVGHVSTQPDMAGEAVPTIAHDVVSIPVMPMSQNASLQIITSYGRMLKSIPLNVNEGVEKIQLDRMSAGVYYYFVEDSGKRSGLKRFIKK